MELDLPEVHVAAGACAQAAVDADLHGVLVVGVR